MLLFPEGLAVGALIHGGIGLVGTDQNPIQGAVVLGVAVVCALGDGAFDAFVGIAVHFALPPLFGFGDSMAGFRKSIVGKNFRKHIPAEKSPVTD